MFPRRAQTKESNKTKGNVKRLQLISVDGIVYILGISFLFFFVVFFVLLIDRILVHGSVWRLIHHPKSPGPADAGPMNIFPSRSRYIVYDIVTQQNKPHQTQLYARTSAVLCVRIGAQLWSLRKTRMKNDVVYAFLCVT